MRHAGRITPALFWRAFFVFVALTLAGKISAANAPSAPPELSQFGKPDALEAARLLEQFRQAGIPGEFFLDIELRSLPRRGAEQTFQGRLWAGRNTAGAITRVELTDAAGVSHRLLIQNGERPAVWRFEGGRVAQLEIADLFAPLIPGVEITAFDVQMPFLYWPDSTLERIVRVLGRPTYAYLFRAPAEFTAKHGDVVAARAYLDTQFNQLLQTELIGRDNKVVKTFAFVSLKKVGDQHVPKQADYRNEVTRDKTRLQITGAALHLTLPPTTFLPEDLTQPGPLPPAGQVVRIDP